MTLTNKKLFAHRGFWKQPEEQNTTEAILKAFKAGFDVEIDIRVTSDGKLVTGHDKAQEIDWKAVFSCPERRMIAFHVKEKGLANKLFGLIADMDYLEYIIFGVEDDEMDVYIGLFGYDSVAFEFYAEHNFEDAFNCRNKVIWIAELLGNKVTKKELIVLKSQKKILYIVTQDCNEGDMVLFGVRLVQFEAGLIDGLCTDNPDIIKHYTK